MTSLARIRCVAPRLLPALAALLAVLPIPAVTASATANPHAQQASAELQLAEKYAPIVYLKRQEFECDPDGEPYLPAPVEITFGDPDVALRVWPEHEEVKRGIGATDLFGRDETYYVDLPGDPEEPGCGYERHARRRMGNQPPVVYAHVATEPGRDGLALQYWFYYYFNDFNDKHESDWEMMQILFDADSAEEALTQEPVLVALSQHKGGETAPWDGDKLRKEDGRPVVYPSRGSHGNYYEPGIWLGWGANGSGLGCDNTTGPSLRLTPEVRLVPDAVAGPDDPFAWSTFGGRWGQREAWVYDGPRGPNLNARWDAPISWLADLRDTSLKLQEGDAVGPSATGVFCGLVRTSSDVYTQYKAHPRFAAAALASLSLGAVGLVVLAAPILRAAAGIYVRHLRTFALIGAVLVPIGLAANAVHLLLVRNEPIRTLVAVTEEAPFVPLVVGLTLGNLQHLAALLLVGPAVVQAVADVRSGRRPSVVRAYRTAAARLGTVAGAGLRALAVVTLLALTVVGLPWAIARAVRWGFLAQAVVLDGANARHALIRSAAAVSDRWWRAAAVGVVLFVVGAALGPLLGIPLMIFLDAPLDLVNGLSGLVYALTHPFAAIGATLLYLRLKGDG